MIELLIGSDHAGFQLKETIKEYYLNWCNSKYKFLDVGCFDTNSVDYPNIAECLIKNLSKEIFRGILICGTGIGMSIAANRYSNIRAALCHDYFTTKMSRLHNDSNILILGSRILENNQSLVYQMIDIWINTKFEGKRHQKRLNLIRRGI